MTTSIYLKRGFNLQKKKGVMKNVITPRYKSADGVRKMKVYNGENVICPPVSFPKLLNGFQLILV
jgi:hypothetical protein